MKRYTALLLASLTLLVSCGGGEDDAPESVTPPFSNILPGGPTARYEESDTPVALSAGWTSADSRWGWSGGGAVQSSSAGAKATLTFSGSAVRWIGARGRGMGKARVSVDGGAAREVDLFMGTTDEIRTNVLTIYDLSEGPHTLTIEVVSGVVVVDAFEINPKTTVSHLQESDASATYSAGWTSASTELNWSGSGVSTVPNPQLTAQETSMAGATVSLPFRGTAISWVGYKGPDGGIATVQIDGGTPVEVDTYSPTIKVQAVLFTASGLSDANHTLTITAKGEKNSASSGTRIVVDAFDVATPGRRAEENDASITYNGFWDPNTARVFSQGAARRAQNAGSWVAFTFNGTSVSWIGARKSIGGGTARIYLDGVFVKEVTLRDTYPNESYQTTIFRVDGLPNERHTLRIEASSEGHVYVDAFDVHP